MLKTILQPKSRWLLVYRNAALLLTLMCDVTFHLNWLTWPTYNTLPDASRSRKLWIGSHHDGGRTDGRRKINALSTPAQLRLQNRKKTALRRFGKLSMWTAMCAFESLAMRFFPVFVLKLRKFRIKIFLFDPSKTIVN